MTHIIYEHIIYITYIIDSTKAAYTVLTYYLPLGRRPKNACTGMGGLEGVADVYRDVGEDSREHTVNIKNSV